MVPGVCPDVIVTLDLCVVTVGSPADVAFPTVPSIDVPVDCVPVADTLVVSCSLDDGPVVVCCPRDDAVLSVISVNTLVVPVPITVFLLVCSP